MKKKIGIIADVMMLVLMLAQLLYVFEGGLVHEILGMAFFACFLVHLWIKRYWYKVAFRRHRTFADVVIILLSLSIVVLFVTSVAVSRILFPWGGFPMATELHYYTSTATLVLSVLHGSLHWYRHTKKKKRVIAAIVALCLIALGLGLGLVPYLNRHFKIVHAQLKASVEGPKVQTDRKVLTVYFTRLGNTDFEEDVDAVSGASLMITDGELMGNTEMLALMVQNALGCDVVPITLTGTRYSSSYNATVSEATKEKKADARPAIEPIDIAGYDDIILVYPLWWYTIPMPVATFLESGDFSGKTIYLLATQGSSGFSSSAEDVARIANGAEVVKGVSIYCDDVPFVREEIGSWLAGIYE